MTPLQLGQRLNSILVITTSSCSCITTSSCAVLLCRYVHLTSNGVIRNKECDTFPESKTKRQRKMCRWCVQISTSSFFETKHILSDLNSTLLQSYPNDEITEEEFNEAFRRSGKDSAPGLGKVWWVSNGYQLKRTGLCCTVCTRKALTKAKFQKNAMTRRFLKPIPKPGKDHQKLNGYRIFTMQNTVGKAHWTHCITSTARSVAKRVLRIMFL